MTGGDDSFIVLKHVYSARHPGEPFDIEVYRRVRRECRDLVRDHFPHEMSVRMLLKPLGLGPRTQRVVVPVIAALARRVVPYARPNGIRRRSRSAGAPARRI